MNPVIIFIKKFPSRALAGTPCERPAFRNVCTEIKRRLIILAVMVLLSGFLYSQPSGQEYRRVKIGDYQHIVCGMDLSPDGKQIAISSIQGFPFFLFDWESETIQKTYDVGNWYAGSSVKYSKGGKYVLLNQLFYLDFAVNKDREVAFEIIDVATGKRVKRFDEYHAVAIAPDSRHALSLTAERVDFWNLETGKKEKGFTVENATNGLAISPDGKFIAVSHGVREADIKDEPRFKQNKKALKDALKYKEQITVFDAESFEPVYTVNELYDIVYRIEYTRDGSAMICLQIPHLKAQASNTARQTYVSSIDAIHGEALRKGFTSQAFYEPDFKFSHDGRLFGLVSKGARFLELHVYDVASGSMVRRFEQSYRLFEKNEGGMIAADSRMSFVFLPDDDTIVMTMGNHLIYWELNLKNEK